MTVGRRIEAIWRAKNPSGTLQDLADALGVSYETLRKWRADTASPSAPRQRKIALLLGCAVADFMFEAAPALDAKPLSEEERRLLRAFRGVLKDDRAQTIERLERRAVELQELRFKIAEEDRASTPALEKRPSAA